MVPLLPPSPEQLLSTRESLGTVLADLRLARGLSQRELISSAAEQAGTDLAGLVVSAATHWERDRRVPSPPHLLALLRVLLPTEEPARGVAFVRVLEAASHAEPLYVPTLALVQRGEWTPEQWSDWALKVRRRVG